MIPARIPRVRRASPAVPLSSAQVAEADYCISVRIWDALLWFAIMRRPRRDVGICNDFANTLAEYSVQLLPRSIFPYDLVGMTRLDPIERTQVCLPSYEQSMTSHEQSFIFILCKCRFSWTLSLM
jgi:hypothetical protein